MRESTRQALRTHPLDDLVSSRGYSEAESAFVRTLHDKVDAYVPAPYAGSVLFYCAVDGDGDGAMNNRNMHANHMIRVWRSLTGRLTVSKIDADHISLIKGPAVADLARPMRADLDRSDIWA
jgi:thioesterase domain-containing protein